jgi:hypothetical protein
MKKEPWRVENERMQEWGGKIWEEKSRQGLFERKIIF